MDHTTSSTRMSRSRGRGTAALIALTLLIIGALNWGLVGLFSFDLVAAVFGPMSVMSRIVYVVVAIAGLYALSLLPKMSRFN